MILGVLHFCGQPLSDMSDVRLLCLEMRGFLFLLVAMLAYRMLTRQINLGGLFARKTSEGAVSPERVQLLLATIAVSAGILSGALHSTNGALPDVSKQWLAVFGSSSGLYVSVKAFTTLKSKFWKL
jgi:hypothetical protein